jgi:predicted alpha/beta superfamily hydrolase
MQKRVLILLTLLFTCFAHARADQKQIVIGQTNTLHSAILNEDRTYRVSLPASYAWAEDRKYPVLYVLDGQDQFVHTATSASFLAEYGEIPEMIVVGIDSTVRVRDFTQTDWPQGYIGGGGAPNFKRFLSQEFIPTIEKAYRTNEFRAISGHSAAGQFVLYCLTSEPSLFQAYMALSSSLYWDNNLPQRSLESSFQATQSLKAFLYVARSNDFAQALAEDERLVQTLKTTAPAGFRWYSADFPNENHASMALLAQIDALRRLYDGYRLDPDMMDQGTEYAEQHFAMVSKIVGYPIAVPEDVINDLAYSALQQGKTEQAIALFKRNVEANPNSANAFDGLADGYDKAGRKQDAVTASDKAAELAVKFDNPNQSHFAKQAQKRRAQLGQDAKK